MNYESILSQLKEGKHYNFGHGPLTECDLKKWAARRLWNNSQVTYLTLGLDPDNINRVARTVQDAEEVATRFKQLNDFLLEAINLNRKEMQPSYELVPRRIFYTYPVDDDYETFGFYPEKILQWLKSMHVHVDEKIYAAVCSPIRIENQICEMVINKDIATISWGGRTMTMKPRVGLKYIAEAIRNAPNELSAFDLNERYGSMKYARDRASGYVSDRKAVREVSEKIKAVKSGSDIANGKDLKVLETYKNSAENISKQLRLVNDSPHERVRKSVLDAIGEAIKKIAAIESDTAGTDTCSLAIHLKNSIHTGSNISYRPDKKHEWKIII